MENNEVVKEKRKKKYRREVQTQILREEEGFWFLV
jgi:hypothetical protein